MPALGLESLPAKLPAPLVPFSLYTATGLPSVSWSAFDVVTNSDQVECAYCQACVARPITERSKDRVMAVIVGAVRIG
jgi:hypothetical protein